MPRTRHVEVTDLRDGKTYRSINRASAALYVSASALYRCYAEGKTECAGIPVDFKKSEKPISCGHPRPVRCVETGEVFPSLKEAAQSVGLKSPVSICLSARRGYKAAGYHWEYCDD